MKRRPVLLLVGVAALVVLNLWRWGGERLATRGRGDAAAGRFAAADFRLKIGVATSEPAAHARDIFAPRLPPALPVKRVQASVEAPPSAPVKTAQELAEEAARAEIGQIKLVGVVFRGEQGQAFLVKGEQVYLVQAGARVGERFRVEAISTDGIQLRDPATQVSGRIPVSGK